MNIEFIKSKLELNKILQLYYQKYDKIFFITQQSIIDKNTTVQNLINKKYLYICEENEQCKSIIEYQKMINFLHTNGCNKNSLLIAIGGGTITDLVGFVSGTYMRGIAMLSVPTTLLGMVDASIGGKTALNFEYSRNLIGLYYNPICIIIYSKFIHTLNKNEIINGLAEIIKYALILDVKLFNQLENSIDDILNLKNEKLLNKIIKNCIKHKNDIVQKDQFDNNIRNILNFGHTVGHALESYYDFKMAHGLAVLYGMLSASYLSYQQQLLSENDYKRIKMLINTFNLSKLNIKEPKKIMQFIDVDKKNISNKLNYILLQNIGSACIKKDFNKDLILQTIKFL